MSKLLFTGFTVLSWILAVSALHAQVIVTGEVRDTETNETVPLATVRVFNGDSMVRYAIVDQDGRYRLRMESVGLIKVASMGYKTFTTIFADFSQDTVRLDIALEPSSEMLEEVAVEDEATEYSRRGDTLVFNLDQLTTGQERSLKDLLNRLPGIEVRDDGTIRAYGKEIDKFLVDGMDLFDANRRLAAEGLQAQMVDSVKLIENYEEDGFSTGESEPKTALDVTIKEEFRNTVSGKLSGMGAYEEFYDGRSEIFFLGKDVQAMFIGRANNVGDPTISFGEYMKLRGGYENMRSGFGNISINSNPAMNNGGQDFLSSQSQGFGAGVLWKPRPNTSQSLAILGARQDQLERRLQRIQYLDGPAEERTNRRERELLAGYARYKGRHIKKEHWFVDYGASYAPKQEDVFEERINDFTYRPDSARRINSSTDETMNSFSTMTRFGAGRKFDSIHYVGIQLKHQYDQDDDEILLRSPDPILGLSALNGNGEGILQLEEKRRHAFTGSVYGYYALDGPFSLSAAASFRVNQTDFRFDASGFAEREDFQNEGDQRRYLYDQYFGISYNPKGWNFYIKPRLSSLETQGLGGNYRNSYFTPKIYVGTQLSQSSNLWFRQERRVDLVRFERLNPVRLVESPQTLREASALDNGDVEIRNQYQLNYSLRNPLEGYNGSVRIKYTTYEQFITNQSQFEDTYNLLLYQLGRLNRTLYFNLGGRYALGAVPVNLSGGGNFRYAESEQFSRGAPFNNITRSYGGRAEVESTFEFPLNATMAYAPSWSRVGNDAGLPEQSLFGYRLSLGLDGVWESGWRFASDYAFRFQEGRAFDLRFHVLDFEGSYRAEGSPWETGLVGRRALQLDDFQNITNNVSENSLRETQVAQLPGYIGLRVAYYLE